MNEEAAHPDLGRLVRVKISPVLTATDGTRTIKFTRWPGGEDETTYHATHDPDTATWAASAAFNAAHPTCAPLTGPSVTKIKRAMRRKMIGDGVRIIRARAALHRSPDEGGAAGG